MTENVFHLIPHTHWDREWYLPAAAFRARLVLVMDDLIQRLNGDPAYRCFLLDGQTVLLEDYLRIRPEREPELRALVQAGRLEIGPWYVLADEQIPSGESLVRNLLAGMADAERFGGRLDVLYSPDAFGHPAVLPALAREFGIRYAVVWRGLGGEPGQERDLYRWRAPDGRDVVLWHLPRAGYDIGGALPADPDRVADPWRAVRNALLERAATNQVPVFVGADHHAPHPAIPALRDAIATREPKSAARVSRLQEFFEGVERRSRTAPVVSGELRWSYRYTWTLQGVHATRAHLKRRHALLELLLSRYADPLVALTRLGAARGAVVPPITRDRRATVDLAWRTLLRCQFHDAIGGCSSDEVAVAMETRFEAVAASAREAVRGAMHDLVGHDPDAARNGAQQVPTMILWNPAARAREGVVIADVTFFRSDVLVGPPPSGGRRARMGAGFRPFAFLAADGRMVPVQVLSRRAAHERLDAQRHYPDQDEVDLVRVAFEAPAVRGLSRQVLITKEGEHPPPAGGAAVAGRALLNRHVEVTLQPNGALAVFDRRSREWFMDALRLEDDGDAGDTYTYCPMRNARLVRADGPIRVRRLAGGPLVAALEARFRVRPRLDARLVVTLHADSPIIRCVIELENHAVDHRLRARLPLRLPGIAAVAGTAFGAVSRPPVVVRRAEFPLETPVPTAPAHRWVAAARGRRGLALLAPGFFEYEWTPSGDLLITMLRSVGELSRADLPTRPGHAAWPTPTPLAQCPGTHRIEIGLVALPAGELERHEILERHWEDTFLPLRGYWLRDATADVRAANLEPRGIFLEGEGLVFSTMKPARAGNGIVLRCYNASDRESSGLWRFEDGVKTAHRVRADEREPALLAVEDRGKTVRFAAGPREIVTILIT